MAYAAHFVKNFASSKFSWLMMLSVILAFLFPELVQKDSVIPLSMLAKGGVVIIFFIYGASLSINSLTEGFLNWRIYAICQFFTFIVFPILGIVLYAIAQICLTSPIELGFIFLTALPSTISSCVSLTAIARGNIPAAVFNATLSCLLGFFITPIIVTLAISSKQNDLLILDPITHIILILLLPLIVGQLFRQSIKHLIEKNRTTTHAIERGVILLIIFNSFSESVNEGVWWKFHFFEIATIFAMITLVLCFVLVFSIMSARLVGLSRENEVVVVFCGTSKSLANGVPISQVLFSDLQGSGLLLLPLLIFHQLHMLVCSLLANHYLKKFKNRLDLTN
ncbi:MAG: hypothetical protein TECD_00276 [Hyphomicrobiaceae bacterium hypho_1]